ncbi:cation channel domain-containing protein [Cyclospora cayetanensis]|uniref:Cation channel domain-containing protein n=1 Tax=Cyclospora cayetanensis TaxID=88456 RepID=A0A1D3CXC1_9EIME|nr:cation channel domain-containing protein [Cyclospora cayetanensis]
MANPDKRSFESETFNMSSHTGPLHESSGVTQGTERTDNRLSSVRSRALSSLLSISTSAAVTPLEYSAARGQWGVFCFKVRDSRLSRALLMLTVLLDCLVTALGATNIAPPFLTWTSNILLLLGPICLVITGAGSRGVWSTKHAYLRSWSGWLDCIFLMNISADVLYCFGVGAGWWTHSSGSLAFLAILRNARAWVLLRICRTFRSAISQLARSAKDLVAVCVLVLVFSVLVLIVLLHFYGFTCWYRCYPDLPLPAEVQASDSCSADSFFWDVDESQFRFCSDKSPCREGTQCRNLFLYSVTSSCTAEDRRLLQDRAWRELQTNEEAAFGVIGLHTLGAAAVTILQGFTLEGWALTMQRQVDGDHSSAGVVAYIAFPALVVVGGMFLMNLAIAVLWEAFDAAKAEQATRPAILREAEWRVYQLLGTDWIKYLMVQLSQNWETASKLRSPLLPITEDFKAEADYELVKEGKPTFRERLCALRRQADRAVEFQFPQLKNRLQFLYAEVTAFSFRIATHRFTPLTMLTVVAIDTVSLLAEGGTDTSIMYTTIYILTSVVFVFEALVLVLAFGRQGLKDGFICLDILMACLTVVDGVYALAKCPHLSGCRTTMVETDGVLMSIGVVFSLMRPFRLFKLVKYFPPLRMTAEMLWVLHSALLPYVLLLIYSCAVMAQLGLFLFFDSKYLSVHSEGASLSVTKYLNFENPGNALLLLAAILTGEGWDLFFREFAQVYGREWTEFTFDSGQLSDFVLSGAFRVTAINTFLYIALLALNCVIFNLYGAVMIGQFIRTQKSLTVKHVANFIATCRNAGIKMPAEDALQGKNAQALYAVVDMSTDAQRDELIKAILLGSDHDKSAKAFGEFARKTSLAFDICKRVALKSNRLATRNSFGSISWTGDRHSSRSYSDIPVLSDKPNNKGLINDTGFDRAVAGHDLDHTLENSVTATSGISGRHSIAVLEKNKEETVPRGRINNSGALLHLDYLLVESRKLDIATKAAVQFVEAPGAGENKSAEELQFRELCSMFWSAVRDAIRQGRIALIEAAKVGLAQITPIDPHSVALQMAYLLLQIASLVELIIECAMKKSITSWKMHTILELGFQLALTADIFLRLGISSIREAGEPPSVYLAYANITSLSESFLSVFILTTSEGWPSLLTRILDLGDRHHVLTIILCSLVIALLSVFVMNLFVGVIVDVLEKEQANLEYTGGVRSATVLRWNEVQRAIFNSSAAAEVTKRRGGMMRAEGLGARDWLSQIIASKQVDLAVAIVSVASCLSLTATGAWAETSLRWRFPSFQNWIFWANAIFVVAYIIEQCFRALVLRKSLFEKGIYVFDFAIALLSLVALIIALSTSLNTAFPAGPLWPVGFRMVRVAYVICHRLPVMHVISITMLNVFAALRRVLLVLGGIILFYGLLGTCLFYDAPIDPKLHFTFASLLDSILLLMSCCTGENWHDIMLQGRAFYYKEGDAVLGWSIMVYSVTFTIVAFLLLMNVFMSTVLKGYVDAKRNQSLWKVAQQHNELMNKWRLREMKLSWLPIHVAVQVLTEIPAPIGYKNLYCEMGSRRMHAILASLAAYSLPIRNNSVHIRDVVLTTTCRACEAHAQNKETPIVVGLLQQRQAVELNPRFVSTWMKRFSDISGTASEFTVLHYLAALNIQAFWRTRRLLERNTATEQLMYMKHLLFLLETAAPICARRSERTDHRRSTLRRKRGIKGGGSIVRMSTALSRRGTFARPPKLSQPKERMKSALKRAVRGQSPRNNESEQISSSSSRRTCQSRLLQDEKLDHHSQRERPKSVRRGTVSEYIISLAEDHTRTASDHTGTLGKASAAQLSQEGQNTLFLRDSARASFTGKCDSRASSRSEPDSTTGLTASGAAPQIPVAGSSSTMRYSMVSGADSGYLSNEYPFTTHPTANAPPRRSNMRPSQPFLEPPPRRSLHRVSSSTRLHQQSFTDAGQANVIVPTRRRGQSVQFTGVERRELQHLLTPALVADDSSDFDKDEGGKTSLSKFAA